VASHARRVTSIVLQRCRIRREEPSCRRSA
jgi:hypothetical protein